MKPKNYEIYYSIPKKEISTTKPPLHMQAPIINPRELMDRYEKQYKNFDATKQEMPRQWRPDTAELFDYFQKNDIKYNDKLIAGRMIVAKITKLQAEQVESLSGIEAVIEQKQNVKLPPFSKS